MIPAAGLAFASLGAILAFNRGGVFIHGMTDARLVCMVAGILPAAHFHKWRDSKFMFPVVAYGLCMVPALFVTRSWQISLFGHPGVYSGSVLTFLLCAMGLLIAEQLEEGRDLVRNTILAAGSATVLVCLAQRAVGFDPFRIGTFDGRAVGFLGSPIDIGALLVVLLTFAPLGLPIYAAGLWAAASRGAWVAALVALTPRRFRVAAFVLATVVGISCMYLRPTNSDAGRVLIWNNAPLSLMGSGPATFNLTFPRGIFVPSEGILNPAHAHNSVIDTLSTKGVFGLMGLLALLWAPELAGLWTICMFNPVSFEVTFIACVLAGLSRSPK